MEGVVSLAWFKGKNDRKSWENIGNQWMFWDKFMDFSGCSMMFIDFPKFLRSVLGCFSGILQNSRGTKNKGSSRGFWTWFLNVQCCSLL